MVGRSNAISREICRAQDVDDMTVKRSSGGHCFTNGPGPAAPYRRPQGNKPCDTGPCRKKRLGRSQSSRSSEEAVQHNAVERRGAGR
jgi:hypothetical protein